jgi:hypothetical protein
LQTGRQKNGFDIFAARLNISMKKICFLFLLVISTAITQAQEILPGISVRNASGKIIVSWKNEYQQNVTTINIQRSYDSLTNYTTIGSVLNPLNKENGYADLTAPYNKMYYRVFIAFEGGSYIISKPVRPVKDTASMAQGQVQYPWQVTNTPDPGIQVPPAPTGFVPSKNVFTARDNNVIIHLADVENKRYVVKFFDELDNLLFELPQVKEDYLIVDKVNFKRSGWFHFEVIENGKTIEKHKFFIAKDGRITNDIPKKPNGNR